MSYIKSDSLFSSIKNGVFNPDINPNDSTSNIFKSLLQNLPSKPKSILLKSLFDVNDHNFHSNGSLTLMDRMTAGYRQNPINSFHYNWLLCKSEGLSEEEDDNEEASNQQDEKQKIYPQIKQQPLSINDNQLAFTLPQPKKVKNETKNIPKNYGKAIISFIQKNSTYIETITERLNVDYDRFLADLKKRKKSINTIADLRILWSKYEYAKCMRIVSFMFLRKYALSYIFDSRICTFNSHIKYRQRLCQAVSNPEDFRHIKDY